MSLARARLPDGRPVRLKGGPPYDCDQLGRLMDVPFELPCDDPWLLEVGTEGHRYLEQARLAWEETPEWMDFLDLDSPACDIKRAERDLYVHHWAPWLSAKRALDVGAGIGRFTTWLLDRGADVWAVDGDPRSLQRCVWHSARRNGRLDVSWSSVHRLPEVEVDAAIVAEVLCYVPDAVGALRGVAERVRPGGAVLLSVEARWGWATAQDAPSGGIEAALSGDGVVDLPGDRWVQTYEEADVRALIEAAGLRVEKIVPFLYVPDGPLEDVAPPELSLEALIALEERCRAHPVWGRLNRMWAAVAIK